MTKSNEQKTPIIKVSRTRIAIKNSFNLTFTEFIQETTQIGAINAVSTMNKIEIPSIPNLNFMYPLIQFFSSTNWKPWKILSNDHHKNMQSSKFTNVVRMEIYIAPRSFFELEKKIKNEPSNGKKIIKDNIGKFIISK